MKHFKKFQIILLASVLGFAVNCSSSSKRISELPSPDYTTLKFNEKIAFSYLPEAEASFKDNSVFIESEFLNYFKDRLKTKGAISEKAKETIEIKVIDSRFRSVGVAVIFGIFAGTDSIELDVFIKDAKGQVIDKHNVTVSSGFGGLLGGQKSVRAQHFYERVTALILKQIGYPE